MWLAERFVRVAQRLDQSWLGWSFRAACEPPPERISPTLTTEDLTAALARANPVAARLLGRIEPTLPFASGELMAMPLPSPADQTPECGAEPGAEGGNQTPQRTPRGRDQTPKAPRRALHWYEQGPEDGLWRERCIDLGSGCVDEHGRDAPMDRQWPIEVHARMLFEQLRAAEVAPYLDDPPIAQGTILRGLFAYQIEHAYYDMCLHRWWHPYRWGGTNGVAQHLRVRLYGRKGGTLPKGRLPYPYLILPEGGTKRAEFYPITPALLERGQCVVQLTPKRAQKAAKRTPRVAPTASPSRVRRAA
jgi:hypothetical protein